MMSQRGVRVRGGLPDRADPMAAGVDGTVVGLGNMELGLVGYGPHGFTVGIPILGCADAGVPLAALQSR